MTATGKGLAIGPIAQAILATIESHYAAASGIDLPDRRIIAPGAPEAIAWDCAQVVVCLSSVESGDAPGEGVTAKAVGNPTSATGTRHATFGVQVVRRSPESHDGHTPPPPDDMTAAGLILMRDAGLLSQALIDVATVIRDAIPAGSKVRTGAVTVMGPDGGYTAVQGSLAVTVLTLA